MDLYNEGDWDWQIDNVADLVLSTGKASASLIQRRLKLGYARAARVLGQLEMLGVVGPTDGAKPRKILMNKEDYKKIIKPKVTKQEVEPIPSLKWNRVKASLIKNKYLAGYVGKTMDFEILLGKDSNGELVTVDMQKVGNVIISGSQFTSVKELVNQIIVSATLKWSDQDLKLILIDGLKNDLIFSPETGQLLTPVIKDPEKPISALKWAVSEVENRMKELEKNEKAIFPKILIVIHGLEEIYCFSPSEIEDNLVRLQRFGRKVGIYLILTMDYISFTNFREIIANNPARIAFKPVDNRFKERNLPQVVDLNSPDEAILWTMYGDNIKFEILKLKPEKIYKQIFSKLDGVTK